ncbi:uncharacterized protein LOC126685895 isoform X2 [Mercurialis annua]|uniref:uncharacterized protein LOC126685895 isoform X2 n=1 Tax=Mercurialis annua TaxID=3986 RepID=UPI002160DA14|nr:uncharacterized protein LOC126685895 isoform X2 [Mercurialis annua]
MLCSVSTATDKSSSNWLDRLRSAKGFPPADNLDLDTFLSTSSSHPNPTAQSHTKQPTSDHPPIPDSSSHTGDKQWFGTVTNILCDLFNMGAHDSGDQISRKKITRKQTNPKFLHLTTNVDGIDSIRKDEYVQAATASFHSDNNSNVAVRDCDFDLDEEKEKCSEDNELKGYSKSEVTVIDTSFEHWKFDKLVFRRKNVWKIRDKKGKSWNLNNSFKKRKMNSYSLESGDRNFDSRKKAKVSSSEFDSSKESNADDQKRQDEQGEEIYKDILDDHFQVPRKRIHFSRSPRKSKKNVSSVVLIKALPTSKNCGDFFLKNRPREAQKQ